MSGDLPKYITTSDVDGVKQAVERASNEDINHQDLHGNTPLHRAAISLMYTYHSRRSEGLLVKNWNHTPEVQILNVLADHADPNVVNNNNMLPAHLIINLSDLGTTSQELLRKLVTQENINIAVENDGSTLLHVSVQCCNWAAVPFLLQQGASLNITNVKGDTPLCVALRNRSVPCDKIPLLLSPENINMVSVFGESPLGLCLSRKRVDAAKVILQHGADVSITTSGIYSSLYFYFNSMDTWEHTDVLLLLIPKPISFKYLCRALFCLLTRSFLPNREQPQLLETLQCILCHLYSPCLFDTVALSIDIDMLTNTPCVHLLIDEYTQSALAFYQAWLISYILSEFGCRAQLIQFPSQHEIPKGLSKSEHEFAERLCCLWDKNNTAQKSPLSLLKLCLFTIRNNLSHNLPDIYSQLPVPHRLQDLLSCKTIADVIYTEWMKHCFEDTHG